MIKFAISIIIKTDIMSKSTHSKLYHFLLGFIILFNHFNIVYFLKILLI